MVKIISDSTCDLSPELIAKYDIDILPLHILLGEDEYEDGRNITPQQIYDWSDAHKTTPKTSAPSLAEAIDLFRPYIEEKCEIVCFSISGSMSTSGNVMRLAAEELEASDLVTVVDSANLSTGIGLLVIEAAIMAEKGQSAAEIAATIESLKPNVRASFVVDTLTYLYVPRWPMQRCFCHGRRSSETPPENRRRKRCHGRVQKISWQNKFCHYVLCKRHGRGFKICKT